MFKDDAALVKADYQAQADAVQGKLALVDQLVAEYDADVAAADAAGEIRGIEKGKAMIQLPDSSDPNNKYTQAQMDQATADHEALGDQKARAELQPKLDAAVADAVELRVQLDKATADLAAASQANVELQAKYDAKLKDIKDAEAVLDKQ